MIGPFGRQGPAATLRQHCPQMTQRRCTLYGVTLTHDFCSADDSLQNCSQLGQFFTFQDGPREARTAGEDGEGAGGAPET